MLFECNKCNKCKDILIYILIIVLELYLHKIKKIWNSFNFWKWSYSNLSIWMGKAQKNGATSKISNPNILDIRKLLGQKV